MTSSSSSNPSYPRPTTPSPVPQSPLVPAPPRIPYQPHPTTSQPSPSLPERPPIAPLPAGWIRSTHIVPAAYPRLYADTSGTLSRESNAFQLDPPREGESKEERLARCEGEARECVRRRFDAVEYTTEEGDKGQNGLFLAAERWKREIGVGEGEGEGVTLVVTHANGFHKESWHPTLRRLLDTGKFDPLSTFGSNPQSTGSTSIITSKSLKVDEIWLFDDIHHAASIDLNKGRIGGVHSWSDSGRDIVNFLTHVYAGPEPEYGDGKALTWQNGDTQGKGGKKRKVIGVGHSVGGNALIQAAEEAPSLFHAIFLVEPMSIPHHPPRSTLQLNANFPKFWPLVTGAIKRRTIWPSIAEAAKVKSAPFFASWHEEVWDLYLKHGLVPLPQGKEGEVQLATPSWGEGCVFAATTGIAEGWDKLARLKIPVGFLMAGDSRATQGEDLSARMAWRPERSSNERIMSGGHLLVQEKPDEVADTLYRFIGSLSAEILDQSGSDIKAKL